MSANCKLCGGPAQILGSLGSLRHYRCRNCGAVFSRKVSRQSVTVIEDRPIVPDDIPQSAGAAVRRGDRKVHLNVWGNLRGYVGTSCVEFFRDRFDAAEWLNGATVRGGAR